MNGIRKITAYSISLFTLCTYCIIHIQTFTLFIIKFYLSRNTSLLNTSLEEDNERFHFPLKLKTQKREKTRGRKRKTERGRVAKICDILVFSISNVGSILSHSLSDSPRILLSHSISDTPRILDCHDTHHGRMYISFLFLNRVVVA